MSKMPLGPRHISYLVQSAQLYIPSVDFRGVAIGKWDRDKLGRAFARQHYMAFPDTDINLCDGHAHTHPRMNTSPIQTYKACECFEYNSLSDTWDESDVCTIIVTLMFDAVRRFKGYEEAKWGID